MDRALQQRWEEMSRSAVDTSDAKGDNEAVKAKKPFRRSGDYLATTRASRIAERARQKANAMTEEEAEYYFRRAMARIYAAPSSQEPPAGHERPA